MESPHCFPDVTLNPAKGKANRKLVDLGCYNFREATFYIKNMPYGPNSDSDDPFALFTEGQGTCYSKHSVTAICAEELQLPVKKHLCFYAMTDDIVTGLKKILDTSGLPFIPAAHCFLSYGDHKVDLTEGNCNGKNIPIDHYFTSFPVDPYLKASEKEQLLKNFIQNELLKDALRGFTLKQVLEAQKLAKEILSQKVICALGETNRQQQKV